MKADSGGSTRVDKTRVWQALPRLKDMTCLGRRKRSGAKGKSMIGGNSDSPWRTNAS
jgi:hypothetical protein